MSVDTLIEQVVKLVGHLAWPTVAVLVLVLLQKQIQDVMFAIGRRVATAKSLKLTKSGLELEDYISAVEAKTDSQQVIQEDLLKLLKTSSDKPPAVKTGPQESLRELQQLADQYVKVDIRDWQLRVNKKNGLVRTMALYIVGREMDRSQLANIDHDGIRAGLAGAIHFEPRPGDLDLLARAAERAKGRHTLYKIVMALSRLIDSGYVTNTDTKKAEFILDSAAERADQPLEQRIRNTRALLSYTLSASFPIRS